jgi:eukaryotic-like serine/threonine-protein kinase
MPGSDEKPSSADAAGQGGREIRLGEVVAGKYLVESMLGVGGMGYVLRAIHLELDQAVAIKVMHRQYLGIPDAARRFALEAQATATLKSEHVLRVFEIGQLPSGTPFIVMELLEGIDLATMVETRGPLPVDRMFHYVLQATDAISEAHEHGIIHRDLKPRNIVLTNEGIVKVVDFGLAKALRPLAGLPGVSTRTAGNILVGSPSYMSPEQLHSRDVDARTDVWALGATMFHLLTGETPFPAPSLPALIASIATDDPPRVSDRRSDVGEAVDAVIAQCLRREPEQRFQSIAALQNSLIQLRAEYEAAVSPTGAMGETLPTAQFSAMNQPTPRAPAASWRDDAPTLTNLPDPD